MTSPNAIEDVVPSVTKIFLSVGLIVTVPPESSSSPLKYSTSPFWTESAKLPPPSVGVKEIPSSVNVTETLASLVVVAVIS